MIKVLILALLLISCSSTKTEFGLNGYVISGNVVKLTWREIGNDASINNSNSLTPTITLRKIGIYSFELTGLDANGLSGKDTIQVIIYK